MLRYNQIWQGIYDGAYYTKKLTFFQWLCILVLGVITALGIATEIRYYLLMKNNFLSGASFNLVTYVAVSISLLYHVLYNYKKSHGNIAY